MVPYCISSMTNFIFVSMTGAGAEMRNRSVGLVSLVQFSPPS
jgi:hypothetical protein